MTSTAWSVNHCLAKSINGASWYQFRVWLEYFGKVVGKITPAVPAAGTCQACSQYGTVVKQSLSTRTHIYWCGCVPDRDHNAARNNPESRIRYDRAYRNLHASEQPLRRIDLYLG